MGNRIKRLVILNFVFFTVMYAAYIFKTASEEEWFVRRATGSYLNVEYIGGGPADGFGETDWGEELKAVPGYRWYRLVFRIENKGGQSYRRIPEYALSFPGTMVRAWTYGGKEQESLYWLADPYLPGETSVTGVIYVQVPGEIGRASCRERV